MYRPIIGRRVSRFTLVELIVVISVIAVLAATLLPMVQQSVKKVRNTRGMSNSKQIVQGLTMYADENDGVLYGAPGEEEAMDHVPMLWRRNPDLLENVAKPYGFADATEVPRASAPAWTDPKNTATVALSPWSYWPGYRESHAIWNPQPHGGSPTQIARANADHVMLSDMAMKYTDMYTTFATYYKGVQVVNGEMEQPFPETNPSYIYGSTIDPAGLLGFNATFYDGHTEFIPLDHPRVKLYMLPGVMDFGGYDPVEIYGWDQPEYEIPIKY